MEPITFFVTATDTAYVPLSPDLISDLSVSSSLTRGSILNDSINYLGSGRYEIKSEVEGTGTYLGKISFSYLDSNFESPAIQIDVRTVTLAIDTSKIPPMADLNTTNTFKVKFASSLGDLLDPDKIRVVISLPSGFEEELLNTDDLIRLGIGEYEFSYHFEQVELYTICSASERWFASCRGSNRGRFR